MKRAVVTSESEWPLVTITTPTLNPGPMLLDAVASVDHQTYPHIEHVIADGGSGGEHRALLDGLAGARRSVLVGADTSMYAAINKAILGSAGSIILNLNSDDLLFPEAIAEGVRFLEQRPEVDIAYGDHLSLFPLEDSFDVNYIPPPGVDLWGRVLVYLSQPAVFVRRRVFDAVGLFDEKWKAVSDFEFWLRAHRRGVSFAKLPSVGSIVRMHGSNLSRSDTWWNEFEALKRTALPEGVAARWAERYRLLRRKMVLNRFTVPFHLRTIPRRYVGLSWLRYYRAVLTRRPTAAPVLALRLPFFQCETHRALHLTTK